MLNQRLSAQSLGTDVGSGRNAAAVKTPIEGTVGGGTEACSSKTISCFR